jgi:DNA repair photolyase
MAAIYEPQGAAREYSPLALNYIKGCDHGCVYCYVPNMMKRFNSNYVHSNVYIKEESLLMKEIELSAKKNRDSPKQVFLSFTTDPYSHFNNETKLTRRVLEILLKNNIPVSILSKGGSNMLSDIDLFKEFGRNIQVGASLTFTDEKDSLKWEKNGALPDERFETLRILHENGIKTWASMEPVIFPEQSLEIMRITSEYVDGFKIGKLNHFKKHEDKFNWTIFLNDSIKIMRENKKLFYIKNDLSKFSNKDTFLLPHERDMDFMALKNSYLKEKAPQINEELLA